MYFNDFQVISSIKCMSSQLFCNLACSIVHNQACFPVPLMPGLNAMRALN